MELKDFSTISNTSTSRVRDLDKAGPLCTLAAAAEQLGVTPSTLQLWQSLKIGPRFLYLHIGKRSTVLYSVADLQEFALAELRERGLLKAKRGAR